MQKKSGNLFNDPRKNLPSTQIILHEISMLILLFTVLGICFNNDLE